MTALFSNTLRLRKAAPIADSEFIALRDFVYEKCGIFVDTKKKYLFENRLSNRIKELGLPSYSDYITFLKFDVSKRKELNILYGLITTNETSFFRDQKQLDSFRNAILPEILQERIASGRRTLNIWSAGCSSGEEPYTLAMILQEKLRGEMAAWKINITAVDLSPIMIDKAKCGIYGDYALKTTSDEHREKYFTPIDNNWHLNSKIRNMVNFKVLNLNDPLAVKTIPRSHLIFCRNVIIYFDTAMKKKIISTFYDNLHSKGCLMLGHSEMLHKISNTFSPVYHPGTIAYKKTD